MICRLRWAMFVAGLAVASGAFAAGTTFGSYGGIQLVEATFSGDDFDDVNPTGVVARLGLKATGQLTAELRVMFHLEDDSVDVAGIDSDVETEYLRGVYAVYHLSPDVENSFYGVLGYTEAEIIASANGVEDPRDERGPSIGAGLNFGGFNVEFMQYFAEDDYDAATLGVGYSKRF